MKELAVVMAKLAGIRKAILGVMDENVSRNRSRGEVLTRASFAPDLVHHYFDQASDHLTTLKRLLPDLYEDFQSIKAAPEMEMAPGGPAPFHYSRAQAERLVRDIDQIFEIRANSELAQPKETDIRRVFISHGRSADWRQVQPFIEKDVRIPTLELEQEPNLGRTIIEKLIDNADRCSSAVIVMTGDDVANEDQARVRENVMHEIGFFQGRYGRDSVILLHEEGAIFLPTSPESLISRFPKGALGLASMCFSVS